MDGWNTGATRIDRRTLLRLTGAGAAASALETPALAQEPAIRVANPKYGALYAKAQGYYFQDAQWVKETAPRLTWPKAGERVPELSVMIPTLNSDWLDGWRKFAEDSAKLGLKYNIQQISQARWLELINSHRHGDVEVHPAILRPERVDPSEWLVSRAYGLDRRNYGEWVNEQYDAFIEKQTQESDPAVRLKHVQGAQRVLADDLYIQQIAWGPSILEGYNSDAWDNVVQTRGFGICNFNALHTFIRMKPKTGRKVARIGLINFLETTNLLAAGDMFRAVGRMIYDRLAYFDENLNVVTWACDSWKRVDDRTWDIHLRPGMTFHDGKPVTIQDLKFTFDFMLKWERGIFWTANRFLESVGIEDEKAGVLRVRFKEPYGQFESYFMQLNVILPMHVFQNIMQEQGVGTDPRRLRIDRPMGSGPFKFGRYRKDQELQFITHATHFSRPVVDEIWAINTPSMGGLLGRLTSGEIDFIESSVQVLRPSQAKQVKETKGLSLVQTKDLNWLQAVPRISTLPWRDFEFRRAWHQSLDHKFMIDVVWEGAARMPTANTFLVEGSPWHATDLPPQPPFDLKAAHDILAAAGYSWDSDGRLLYPKPDDANFRTRVEKVSKDGFTWGGLQMLAS